MELRSPALLPCLPAAAPHSSRAGQRSSLLCSNLTFQHDSHSQPHNGTSQPENRSSYCGQQPLPVDSAKKPTGKADTAYVTAKFAPSLPQTIFFPIPCPMFAIEPIEQFLYLYSQAPPNISSFLIAEIDNFINITNLEPRIAVFLRS